MQRRSLALVALVSLLALGCKGGSPAGKYRIQQTNSVIGEGAEKIVLDLRDDKTFDVTAGPMTLLKGNWSADASTVAFSQGQGLMGTSYRIDDDKLVPVANGKDVTTWHWIRK